MSSQAVWDGAGIPQPDSSTTLDPPGITPTTSPVKCVPLRPSQSSTDRLHTPPKHSNHASIRRFDLSRIRQTGFSSPLALPDLTLGMRSQSQTPLGASDYPHTSQSVSGQRRPLCSNGQGALGSNPTPSVSMPHFTAKQTQGAKPPLIRSPRYQTPKRRSSSGAPTLSLLKTLGTEGSPPFLRKISPQSVSLSPTTRSTPAAKTTDSAAPAVISDSSTLPLVSPRARSLSRRKVRLTGVPTTSDLGGTKPGGSKPGKTLPSRPGLATSDPPKIGSKIVRLKKGQKAHTFLQLSLYGPPSSSESLHTEVKTLLELLAQGQRLDAAHISVLQRFTVEVCRLPDFMVEIVGSRLVRFVGIYAPGGGSDDDPDLPAQHYVQSVLLFWFLEMAPFSRRARVFRMLVGCAPGGAEAFVRYPLAEPPSDFYKTIQAALAQAVRAPAADWSSILLEQQIQSLVTEHVTNSRGDPLTARQLEAHRIYMDTCYMARVGDPSRAPVGSVASASARPTPAAVVPQITVADLFHLVSEICRCNAGLQFLAATKPYLTAYIVTVVERILYHVKGLSYRLTEVSILFSSPSHPAGWSPTSSPRHLTGRSSVPQDDRPVFPGAADETERVRLLRCTPWFSEQVRVSGCGIRWADVQRHPEFLAALLKLGSGGGSCNDDLLFFSYKHFYVTYCEFYSLDRFRRKVVQYQDLLQYAGRALSEPVLDRLYTLGHDQLFLSQDRYCMVLQDFIWFLLSSEDPATPTGLSYWFGILDRDGDGILTISDLKYYMEPQLRRLYAEFNTEITLSDMLCHLEDMVNPQYTLGRPKATLGDPKPGGPSRVEPGDTPAPTKAGAAVFERATTPAPVITPRPLVASPFTVARMATPDLFSDTPAPQAMRKLTSSLVVRDLTGGRSEVVREPALAAPQSHAPTLPSGFAAPIPAPTPNAAPPRSRLRAHTRPRDRSPSPTRPRSCSPASSHPHPRASLVPKDDLALETFARLHQYAHTLETELYSEKDRWIVTSVPQAAEALPPLVGAVLTHQAPAELAHVLDTTGDPVHPPYPSLSYLTTRFAPSIGFRLPELDPRHVEDEQLPLTIFKGDLMRSPYSKAFVDCLVNVRKLLTWENQEEELPEVFVKNSTDYPTPWSKFAGYRYVVLTGQ